MQAPIRIAVVEGDDLMRQLVVQWLAEAGHGVIVATEDSVHRQAVELVIADVPNPRAAAPLVRALRGARGVPLILMSARLGRGQAASTRLLRELGAAVALPKPFTRDELIEAIAQAMR